MITIREKNSNHTRLLSLNVNGLGDELKRREIFRYLKAYQADIILLQETYGSSQIESVWSAEWGNKIYFSHGTSNSKGVAILLNRNFAGLVQFFWDDKEGRFLAMLCKLEEKETLIVNVYAPNEDKAEFFTQVFDFLDSDNIQFEILIIGGDFNATLNVDLDRRSDSLMTIM